MTQGLCSNTTVALPNPPVYKSPLLPTLSLTLLTLRNIQDHGLAAASSYRLRRGQVLPVLLLSQHLDWLLPVLQGLLKEHMETARTPRHRLPTVRCLCPSSGLMQSRLL